MNNGIGTGIYFSTSAISTNAISGSVLSFKLKKQADKKEITDGGDNFKYIGITTRKKVASVEVLFTGSGSAITLPEIGDSATVTNPWSADVSGSWAVTDSEVDFKADDAAKVTFELTQWYNGSAYLP